MFDSDAVKSKSHSPGNEAAAEEEKIYAVSSQEWQQKRHYWSTLKLNNKLFGFFTSDAQKSMFHLSQALSVSGFRINSDF